MAGAERLDPRYGWYLATAATWFGGLGLQQVMLPWLVAGELGASAQWIGLVQMANMLPGLVLLVVGGAVADRRDPRGLLTLLHVLAMLPPLVLASAIGMGGLSIAVVFLCALGMGSLNAFSNPARDSLLSEVAGHDVARAVTGLTIAQFGSQGAGMLLAGAARWAGLAPVLAIQAIVVGIGAFLSRRVPRRSAPPPAHGPSLGEFGVGLRIVLGSPLRAVLALTCGIGFLFSASYNVVFPVLVRDVYGGDVRDVSILMLTFPVGTIVGSFALLARGGIHHKGRAFALSLVVAAGGLIVAGLGLPFPVVVGAGLVWGLAGAVFLNMGRTLFQERAPVKERGRVLAVNLLGFMATAPLGAVLAGFVAAEFGPKAALVAAGAAMLVLVGLVVVVSDVVGME
ncbi:MAG: MFS transporter [Myxococcota bacterium]